jgi:hypothetical protein
VGAHIYDRVWDLLMGRFVWFIRVVFVLFCGKLVLFQKKKENKYFSIS